MSEAVCAHIDLSALRHNFQTVRNISGSRPILAMVKADGYGHGLLRVAQALTDADLFGVAAFEEAITLREGGIIQPIVIMSRFSHSDHINLAQKYQLTVVIHQPYQVEMLENSGLSSPIKVWLKIETGMHRLGLSPQQFLDARRRLQSLSWIDSEIGVLTHLACADNPDDPHNLEQLRVFRQVTENFPGPRSIANSAAILSQPQSLADWVRPGIMLYGASPLLNQTAEQCGLRPVMTLTSQLIAVSTLEQGDWMGYGASWQCPERMQVGIVAIGYGDGYPRHARNGTPVLINGVICPLIGRVSMDMIAVDLRKAPHARVNDSVTLWGKSLPVEKIAFCADSISYELLCQINRRVKFKYYE